MAIRLSSRRLQGGIGVQAPRNYGRATRYMPVQDELDHTVARANNQYIEAISVDGFDINYWHRRYEGRVCTCHDPVAAQNAHKGIGETIDDSNDPAMSKLDDIIFNIRDARDLRETVPNKTRDVFDAKVGELPTSEQQQDSIYEFNEETDEEMEEAANEEALQHMHPDAAVLFGAERTRCGICFRTGYVNGYTLHGGRRDILDASGGFNVSLHGFLMDRKIRPNAFISSNDKSAYVQFIYEVPTYFEGCKLVALRDNIVEARGFTVEARTVNTNDAFQIFNAAFVDSLKGTSRVLEIRVRPNRSTLDGTISFTHLEIVYQFAPWPKAQMPNVSESTNFAIFNSVISSSMILPPTIVEVSKEDVVWEGKYGNLWKITDYTDFMTSNRQVCGWETSIRIIQEYEQLALLRIIYNRSFALSFGKLEATQGLRIASAAEF